MPSSHESLLCQYRYDALDRLIGHATANEAQNQRFYCKSRLATEIQGALRHSIAQHGDLLLAQQQRSGNTLDTTLLATDQQRSVVHVVSKAQQLQNFIAYSAYGHRCAENGLLSLLGFNGERPDPITGHYLLGNGYRAFNPALMRFNSPDRLSPFAKGGLNSYGYCWGDPINLNDPTGKTPWGKFITEAIGTFDWMTSKSNAISREFYVAQARYSRNLDQLNAEFLKLENFISARNNILEALKNPLTRVEKLLTTATNSAIKNNLKNPYAHLKRPTFKGDYSVNKDHGQKKHLEFDLSVFNNASILNNEEKIIGFKPNGIINQRIQELPEPKKLLDEIRGFTDKYAEERSLLYN